MTCWKIKTVSLVIVMGLLASCATQLDAEHKREAETHRQLGEAYLAEGKDAAAFKELREAKRLNPEDPYVHYALGIFYFNKGKYDLSVQSYLQCLELDPSFTSAINNLGLAYLENGDYDRAIEQFDRLKDNYVYATPHFPLFSAGRAYYYKNDLKQAAAHFNEAIDLKEDFAPAYLWLGRTLLGDNQPQKAREALEKGLELAPQSAEMYFEISKAYALTQDPPKAFWSLRKVVELDPDSAIGKEARGMLDKAKQ